ncbi:putative 3-methyladenine DNA glycosylase, partial [Clarias magur]
ASRGDGERDPGTPAQRGRSPRNAFSPALRNPARSLPDRRERTPRAVATLSPAPPHEQQ